MDYVEIDSDLLSLAADPSDYNRLEITARILNMKPAERRAFHAALQVLEECYDAAVMELHLRRD